MNGISLEAIIRIFSDLTMDRISYPKDPATFVRNARAKLGLTQAGMAKALLLTDGRAIRQWESASAKPTGPAIVAIHYLLKQATQQP